ncbi:hypothetical protein C8Q74DRAFT_1230228 [Fomes fomentarius]|nr:hypothetical protein C8Q74DRAFT_1230228 [Fomes fomentarius]
MVADNESALETLLDPAMHGQQLVSVIARRYVRKWLVENDDSRRHRVLHWCLSSGTGRMLTGICARIY